MKPTDKRQQRLERNEKVRQANKQRLKLNELKPKRAMTTVVMSPKGDKR